MTRLPFILDDLAQAIAAVSPIKSAPIALVLSESVFRGVLADLEDHFGTRMVVDAGEFRVGDVVIRKA